MDKVIVICLATLCTSHRWLTGQAFNESIRDIHNPEETICAARGAVRGLLV